MCLILSSHVWADAPLKTSLSGKITDKASGEPLPGVAVYLPDLKTGASTGIDGSYKINNLPSAKVLVQVSYVGYKTIIKTIDLSVTTVANFQLEESVKEMEAIVVTGSSRSTEVNKNPAPITLLSQKQILQATSTNIIDAIAKQPGISQITTGPGISKPVIRGLGYNRVVVLNDGIRQEGQQWGDEHGIEIDEFGVNNVEILKGPASLTYGSDAIAGVINIISAPSLPEGKIGGSLIANYQTNNGLIGYSADFDGNRKGFIWDLRYSDKMAHAYKDRYDGYVFNSGFRENNISGTLGLNRSWGYSHLIFSFYHLTPGIIEGERDSATGKFVKPVALNDTTEGAAIASLSDMKRYMPEVPYQQVGHYKIVLNNNFILGNSLLKATLGFQQNNRQEYGNILHPDQYGLYFKLNTINYALEYVLPEKNKFNISFGVNGMQQSSLNKGDEFLVPAYSLFDVGAFGLVKKTVNKKLELSGGIRYDVRFEQGDDLYLDPKGEAVTANTPGATQKFGAFITHFPGASGSLGASYQLSEKVYTKLNLAKGFRAPNIAELGSNGVHEGTYKYEIGNTALKPEHSWQLDYALGLNSDHISAELDLFDNSINNFIFSRKLSSTMGGDSMREGFTAFQFVAGQANLSGGEAMIDLHPHPLDWLHFENSFSYVLAVLKNQPDSMRYLPFTPAPRFTSELRATRKKLSRHLGNAYAYIGLSRFFKQDKVYSAYNTETPTPGYTLLNAGMGTDFVSGNKTLFSFFISGDNLTDAAYQNHLSRLKYEDVNYVSGRMGVFNMGRNISFKLLIPLSFKG